MKVAIITSGFIPVPAVNGGAVEMLDEHLINENEKSGHLDLVIISSYDSSAEKQARNYKNTKIIYIKTPTIIAFFDKLIYKFGLNIFKENSPTKYRYIFQRLWYIRKSANILHKENFDKVIIDNQGMAFLALKLKRNYLKYQNNLYFHVHNLIQDPFRLSNIIRKSKIIGISNYINNTILSSYNIPDSRMFLLQNPVDRNVFAVKTTDEDRAKTRMQLDLSYDDFVYLFTGRIVEEKGLFELIKAFQKIQTERTKLLIVGRNPLNNRRLTEYEKKLKALLSETKSNIIFTDFIHNRELGYVYKSVDVVVIPSIWEEPACLSVMEALTAGRPLITTNSGGIPEYARDGSAILLDKNDKNFIDNLSNEMLNLQNSEIRNQLSKRAVEVSKGWNINTYYENLCSILKK